MRRRCSDGAGCAGAGPGQVRRAWRRIVIDAPRVVDEALAAGRLVEFGGRLVCQWCGWAGPVAAVGLAAAHVRGCPREGAGDPD